MVRACPMLMVGGTRLQHHGGSRIFVSGPNLLNPVLVRVGGGHRFVVDCSIPQESNRRLHNTTQQEAEQHQTSARGIKSKLHDPNHSAVSNAAQGVSPGRVISFP